MLGFCHLSFEKGGAKELEKGFLLNVRGCLVLDFLSVIIVGGDVLGAPIAFPFGEGGPLAVDEEKADVCYVTLCF